MALDPHDLGAVVRFVRAQGRGVVATVSEAAAPEAALVGLVALDDGTILFTSRSSSRKIANLRDAGSVALVVGTEGPVSLQVEGSGVVASAAQAHELEPLFLQHAPGSRVTDPGFALVVVRPRWVRSYDVSGAEPVVLEARWT
ncbi:pyridoxamine 5'-phosphate oxidase family protein [Microbacterium paraoxydans]|uniref:Pyridoxamine 5'-phosphate oxidase family protein n=1 Tax=Microbacterium paraoxydans TaxID=199592 RepID=A0ABS5IPR3_9MICO|nr:pyridoxamine 5'-phosphate oxidase family protein [Microbacterium paraoxydans]MBS0024919.1 pyridoxamine 5'-phosphate oxidase family protein [Microbacterium paraoxydans]